MSTQRAEYRSKATAQSSTAIAIDENQERHWKQNLVICLVGSFTTLVAMSLLLPFLPLYVEQLGVADHAAIVQWSGIAYGATFLAAAIVAPFWGRLGDRYGRKLMLIRASLGMAIAMSLMGMVTDIWQLVALRLFVGIAGGYSSGSMILVATQTPKDKTGWALGALSAGIMGGNLAGPLLGGALPPLIGIRATFWLAGSVIFLTFLATTFLIREERKPPKRSKEQSRESAWSAIPDRKPIIAMLVTGMLLMFANMSIEPIITVYVMQLMDDQAKVTMISGVVMAVAALGSILSASRLGRLADRIGHTRVIIGAMTIAALLLIPQAFVTEAWQLIGLRFLMGLALGGLLPCISSVIRHNVPDRVAGSVLGLSVSAQYVGQVAGPVAGGFVGGRFGMPAVFLCTCALMGAGAIYNWSVLRKASQN
ncbi:multidrug efflux MFS transporter [Brucella rhizosphaerae]|nr:multidrug efflux MFS transporter [Brucella rhizosphaerae]